MDTFLSLLFLVGVIVFIVGAGLLVFNLIKKKEKKRSIIVLSSGAGLFIVSIIAAMFVMQAPKISLSPSNPTINKNGEAKIIMNTEKGATATIKKVTDSETLAYAKVTNKGQRHFIVNYSGDYMVYAKNKYGLSTKKINVKTSKYETVPQDITNLYTNNTLTALKAGITMDDINAIESEVDDLKNGIIKKNCLKYIKKAKILQPKLAAAEAKAKAESESESKARSESIAKAASESSVKQAAADSSSKASSIAASQSSVAAAKKAREESQAAKHQEAQANGQTITYAMLDKNADGYSGKPYYVRGQVAQAQEDSGMTVLRVNVTNEGYDIWDDDIYVTYIGTTPAVEDDVVDIYGTLSGGESYETQMGLERTIPSMIATEITVE
ncbi:hypothetical protein [Loigolactobacillus jiayinensis]|uniref:Uncharacterized protein n=1 Tax=Loigolactobacillus jiayinensis TaxID=2486016 RepID=A0ABW1RD89_9LACO|nr:hypothetical protein [Loigolactobacillus jiayinensis]